MKKLSFIIAMAFLMMGVVACDIIEEPYKKENNGGGNSGGGETPNPEQVVKRVLLEDYTGVKCPNCPAAGEIALNLQQQYGHDLIVLSVHAGGMSMPQPGNFPNFLTSEGTEWYTNFGFDSNPIGTINRKLNGSSLGYNSSDWTEEVAKAIQEEAVMDIIPEIEYNESNRNLKVDITVKSLAELSDIYSLVVCIMEDSIVGKQQVEGIGIVEDFVHRHVFRTTLNGAWGEELNQAAVAPEEVFTKSYTTTLNEAYNADQCYVIAYVANAATKEVLQVVEKKIK